METKDTCLYIHTRKDNGRIFYVGIGGSKRPYSIDNRNRFWKSVVKKYGRDVTILKTDMSWEDACQLEIMMIAFYGRRDKKKGCLVNLTDGGQGNKGLIPSEETKQKIRESLTGKMVGEKNPNFGKTHSEETIQKIREKARNKKVSKETKLKMHENRIGKKHSEETRQKSVGENNSRARKVICSITNKIYGCAKDASKDIGVCYTSLILCLNGKRKNKTSLKYL